MRAVGYRTSLPITAAESLLDLDIPVPSPGPQDLLVAVRAISVNPVDTKVRKRAAPPEGEVKILGWDAAGVVTAVGDSVRLFRPGDEVFYAGDLTRPGTNAEQHLVDARIVGRKPATLSFAEAAALPLTAITAWELLFDRLGVRPGKQADAGALLVIGGAGGVGSILIQLARRLTGLTVIATASRPETMEWCRTLGAHHVVDHGGDLAAQVEPLGPVNFVAGLTATDTHLAAIAKLIAPQGKFALIDDPAALDIRVFKQKSVSVHWEFMFTRSMFHTADLAAQHALLTEVSELVDAGVLRTTVGAHFGTIDAANLKRAHGFIESGQARGKIVLEGF